MATTYEPIATTTLSSTTNTFTFSSIPSSYTDLRISLFARSSGNYIRTRIRFNSVTTDTYNQLSLYAAGSTVLTTEFGTTYIEADTEGMIAAQPSFYSFDIFSYAGSTFKNCLITSSEDKNGTGQVNRIVGMWRSTSAIDSVTIFTDASTFAVGTTATIYGIKAA